MGRSHGRSAAPWAERSAELRRLPASPAPRSTKTRGRPKLRTGPPRLTVALSRSARRTIEDEFRTVTRDGGVETGGWLYAPASRSWHTTIEVRCASLPGEGARHGTHAYAPSSDYQQQEQAFAGMGDDHMCRVGDWHSHPSKHAVPSDADLDVWQNCFLVANEKRNVAYYVGVIAALDNSGNSTLARMRLGAWCLSWDSLDRVTYEPARIA
jgi:proteasome lid subunit RPN8/RPN11